MPCASVSAKRTRTSVEKWKPSTGETLRAAGDEDRQVLRRPLDVRVETGVAQPLELSVDRIREVEVRRQGRDGVLRVGGNDYVGEHEPAARAQHPRDPPEEVGLR